MLAAASDPGARIAHAIPQCRGDQAFVFTDFYGFAKASGPHHQKMATEMAAAIKTTG